MSIEELSLEFDMKEAEAVRSARGDTVGFEVEEEVKSRVGATGLEEEVEPRATPLFEREERRTGRV